MNENLLPGCSIVPSNILERIAERGNARQKELAFQTMNASAFFRGQREIFAGLTPLAAVAPGIKRRTVYDAQQDLVLPGKLVRAEGDPKSADVSVNEAYDGSGKVYDFYRKIFDRNSIDDNGMRLESSVHYRRKFNNALWNGQQMVYGDGDGQIFNRFSKSLDVIGHEMTHGITQYEVGLIYKDQSGALNEHVSDVFGSLIKQFFKKQTAADANWLIGEGIFTKNIQAVALRSMKNPGTAYNDPMIGKDPQPAHMKNYNKTTADNGGVHINSGIPNKAFYDLALALGGYAWEKAGVIWYRTLTERLSKTNTEFQEFAEATLSVGSELFGSQSKEEKAVRAAWKGVGVDV